MQVIDYYKLLIADAKRKGYANVDNNTLYRLDALAHYYEAEGKSDYEKLAYWCKLMGYKGVIDIGCAYGFQSEEFIKQGLRYHGIDEIKEDFFNADVEGVSYQVDKFPCEIDENVWTYDEYPDIVEQVKTGKQVYEKICNVLPVSRLCLGYLVKDAYAISQLLDEVLIDCGNADFINEMKQYYDCSSGIAGIDTLHYFSHKERCANKDFKKGD